MVRAHFVALVDIVLKMSSRKKSPEVIVTSRSLGTFYYRVCQAKKLMRNLSVFMHSLHLYTFYQIEMNLRKPGTVYRMVTSVVQYSHTEKSRRRAKKMIEREKNIYIKSNTLSNIHNETDIIYLGFYESDVE